MKTPKPTPQNLEFVRLIGGSEQETFRFETLQEYCVEGEWDRFQRYLTDRTFIVPEAFQASMRTLRSDTCGGKKHIRVRLVDEPLSEYLRFEVNYYHLRIAAGEDLRVLTRDDYNRLGDDLQGAHDFYLFDSARAFRLLYDDEGRVEGESEVSPDELECYVKVRNTVLSASTPFYEYMKKLNLSQ